MTIMTMVVVVVTLTRMVVMIMIAIVLFNKVLNFWSATLLHHDHHHNQSYHQSSLVEFSSDHLSQRRCWKFLRTTRPGNESFLSSSFFSKLCFRVLHHICFKLVSSLESIRNEHFVIWNKWICWLKFILHFKRKPILPPFVRKGTLRLSFLEATKGATLLLLFCEFQFF